MGLPSIGSGPMTTVTLPDTDDASHYPGKITIHSVPDVALLEIFAFFRDYKSRTTFLWYLLVPAHVCQRWRQIIIASPRRLGLEILCGTGRRDVADVLRHSPPFPLVGCYDRGNITWNPSRIEGALLFLTESERISSIRLAAPLKVFNRLLSAMDKQTPALETLHLCPTSASGVALPKSFSIQNSGRLRDLRLSDILPLPKPPSSVVRFVLDLSGIERTEVPWLCGLIDALCSMPRLKLLFLDLHRHNPSPPPTEEERLGLAEVHTSFPCLLKFKFTGLSTLLETLLSHFDAPSIVDFSVDFTDPLIINPLPSLSRFIDRSPILKTTISHLGLSSDAIYLVTCPTLPEQGRLTIRVNLEQSDLLVSSAILSGALRPIVSTIETLNIGFNNDPYFPDEEFRKPVESSTLRVMLAAFAAVTTLKVDYEFVNTLTKILCRPSSSILLPNIREIILLFSASSFGGDPCRAVDDFEPFISARTRNRNVRLDIWAKVYGIEAWFERHDHLDSRVPVDYYIDTALER
ncbi:hypothetical protein BC834DRAFT_414910 [Gloeopeniophorella convolvens]|nr:hypothetical protein BC834DRAFT_414910 [Gloeopeniophorella convolvens]